MRQRRKRTAGSKPHRTLNRATSNHEDRIVLPGAGPDSGLITKLHAMKTLRAPALVLGLLYLGFLGSLAFTFTHSPARLATHFAASGQPNGWMSRDSHLWHMLAFGLAFPLFVPAIIYVSRFLPDGLYNIPHRDYWFAPARRSQTLAYLFRHSLWFASLALCFVMGIHFSIIHSNTLGHPQLSPLVVVPLAGCFILGTIIWAVSPMRHFNHVAQRAVPGGRIDQG